MFEVLHKLFDASGFMPRRQCGNWTSGEILFNNLADGIIWLSYMAIPVVIIYFLHKKQGKVPFPKVFCMFGAFIVLCGMTHLMDIVMFYNPMYHLAGLIKSLTAAVSLATAIVLMPLVPQALALRSSEELEGEIAERKRAEEQLQASLQSLRESEERFRRLAEATNEVFWIFDPKNSEVLYVSPAYEKIWGRSCQSLHHNAFSRIEAAHPDDLAEVRASAESQAAGQSTDAEYRIVRPDGSIRWIWDRGYPVRNEDGEVYLVTGTAQDITERKEAAGKLEEVYKQLIETSRRAGMAEVATGVLHNVGNVLNTVNVSTSLASDMLQTSRVSNLAKVMSLLQEHTADLDTFLTLDPKGKQLPGYLGQLSDQLSNEQAVIIDEVELIRKNIEHIKQIVAMQQGYAKVSGLVENVAGADLVDEALRLSTETLAQNGERVVREFSSDFFLSVDRHKALQILVNLISNAKSACGQSGRPDKQITVRLTNCDNRVRITVIDNGVGIAAENLTRIFAHGFTTKKDGHGFGLHSGALTAKEMGGSLAAFSEGVGRGATFILELPIQP
ncbi:MAG TPA: PAS domain-containing protein [Bryobacteraceae bacterium]|nr:PAS domain-containing protein [Bryobacteraceae bacterium]